MLPARKEKWYKTGLWTIIVSVSALLGSLAEFSGFSLIGVFVSEEETPKKVVNVETADKQSPATYSEGGTEVIYYTEDAMNPDSNSQQRSQDSLIAVIDSLRKIIEKRQ